MQTLMYDDAVATEATPDGVVCEPNVSIINGVVGGNSITVQYSDDSDGGNSFNCGSSIGGGRRHLPPCEPPPPTPYANVNYKVTEIEYAVPLVRRHCKETATGDVVIYENARGIAVNSSTLQTQNFVSEGRFLQVKNLPDFYSSNSFRVFIMYSVCIRLTNYLTYDLFLYFKMYIRNKKNYYSLILQQILWFFFFTLI